MNTFPSDVRAARATKNPIARELSLFWSFVAGDVSSAVVPAFLFTLAAWKTTGADPARLPGVITRSLLYFSLYLYAFCLANQATGLEEDRRNKPHRPLVRGLVSVRGAWLRWAVVMALFTLTGAWLGVLEYAIGWQLIILVHNVVLGARNWVVKNLCMSLGILVQLAAAWQMVTPLSPLAWRWILLPAAVIFPLVSVQDLRDMNGDRAAGRLTFPLVFGERATRILLAVCFGLLPITVHIALLEPAGARGLVWAADAALSAVALAIGLRVALFRTPREDHITYLLFTGWYCLLLTTAVVVL
ncbi:UbiA family prenyltransferase [Polyangium fumosum]|uniref:Ubiquinone biosynthesis protein UbiA n=1 Tax=Polyangium fumosum TaxID=889272 RepID=A0A4U1JGZ1_9BACT|nr:UbiA family prenyltransferase [Polyangium fumosum]TKD11822.1 ubiquinone biosynthesis protein UbiA [Polyangium fumosum]